MSDCTCYVVDEKYWTTHYGAVEPGSTMEPNPDCPEHCPARTSPRDLLGIAPEWTGGLSTDDWIDQERIRA